MAGNVFGETIGSLPVALDLLLSRVRTRRRYGRGPAANFLMCQWHEGKTLD